MSGPYEFFIWVLFVTAIVGIVGTWIASFFDGDGGGFK